MLMSSSTPPLLRGIVAGAMIAAVLSGCTPTGVTDSATESSSPDTPTSSPRIPSGTPAATVTVPASPTPTAGADSGPHDAEVTAEPSAEEAALSVAAAAVAAYCRHDLAKAQWLAGLYPYLTQQAAIAYETVDPSVVPCSSVTGEAHLRDGDGAYTMRVLVPTDAGEYEAYVHRESAAKPWLVDRFTPPAG
ncbi:hypothetical protein C5D18_04755 [Rathayibacter tritici]|nr:hypothetical protein C5D18_04755 [Rathayibacter tritici]